MKLLLVVVSTILALYAISGVTAEPEMAPATIVSSLSSMGSGAEIIFDGDSLGTPALIEIENENENEEDNNIMEELELDDNADEPSLLELSSDSSVDENNNIDEEQLESSSSSTVESEDDSSLIEKSKKSSRKGGAKRGARKNKRSRRRSGGKRKGRQGKGKRGGKGGKKASAKKKAKLKKAGKIALKNANAIVRTGRGKRGARCIGAKCRRRRHGWGISPKARKRVQQRLPQPRLTGAAATLTRANVRCVLCQFISQKLKNGLTGGADVTSSKEGESAPEGEPASASLIEAFAFASAGEQSRIESHVAATAYADAASSAIPSLFDHGGDSPRRFRHTDILASRAGRARFTQVRGGQPGPETDATRAAYLKLYSTVYASFESLCAKRMPLAYLPYCNDMLKSYRFFAQGINYGDRAEQICMNGNFCDQRAYVRRVTHNTYQREPGDA